MACFTFLSHSSVLKGQIVETPTGSNTVLLQGAKVHTKDLVLPASQHYFELDTLNLPFIDDFSRNKFKDYRFYQYTGVSSQFLNYYEVNDINPFPDSVYWVNTAPYVYSVNGAGGIDSVLSTQTVEIYVYDTLANPFRRIDTIQAFAYQPRLKIINSMVETLPGPFDGRFYKREKEYFIYPVQPWDKSLWVDNYVYRNNHLPVNPPSIGVATFDGINERGIPYDASSSSSRVADYLTSKPIDLSVYSAADSLYLSFFYQAQGLGFYPTASDSLVLEFRSPDELQWRHVWSVEGEQMKPFKAVLIKITDPIYLKKGFQFRFKNYAALNANKDHWMVDYVYLNANRNHGDSLFNDVAIAQLPKSILDEYTRMPSHQILKVDIDEKWENMHISNLNSSEIGVYYEHNFIDQAGNYLSTYPADNLPGFYDTSCVKPFHLFGYDDNVRHSGPAFSYDFDIQWPGGLPFNSKQVFRVLHRIEAFQCPQAGPWVPFVDFNTDNDTAIYHQVFHNYYAYDDSTAESSIYLGQQGEVGYMFESNFADSLRAIQIHFNPQGFDATQHNFTLMVYKDNGGEPGDTLYTQTYVIPEYAEWGPNGFTTYILPRAVALPAGKFYVGWKQNSIFKMNVGMDKNFDRSDRLFFKTLGNWMSFADLGYTGNLMIRPVVGAPVSESDFLGSPVYTNPQEVVHSMKLYPNPAGDYIQLQASLPLEAELEIEIYSVQGQLVYRGTHTQVQSIPLQHLQGGLYICKVRNQEKGFVQTQKFIINR